MLIDEKDLLNFQTCPRKAHFYRAEQRDDTDIAISSYKHIAIWMWTYQVINSRKVPEKTVKEKWASIVRNKYNKANEITLFDPVTDYIANGWASVVKKAYEEYLDSSYQPIATMFPTKYILPHVGVISLNLDVVVIDQDESKHLLSFSEDFSSHDTTTNLVLKTKLLSAKEAGISSMIVTRLDSKLTKIYINLKSIDEKSLNNQLIHIVNGFKNKVDYPILNCRLNCQYKDICI